MGVAPRVSTFGARAHHNFTYVHAKTEDAPREERDAFLLEAAGAHILIDAGYDSTY